MEIIIEITQKNDYRKPCACASYVHMRDAKPFCDDPASPYYLRCPAGMCSRLDSRKREELIMQRAMGRGTAEAERIKALLDGISA